MQIGPWTIARTKALDLRPLSQSGNGWFPWGIIRESFTGAWQNNVELRAQQVLTNPTLFAVVTLIAADVAKLCLRLVEQDEYAIWTVTESPAFSPVLRRPNRYQTIVEFVEQWMISKLTQGNTYVLLQRDQRRVVTAMYVLDPSRVTPLVTPRGDVYYEIRRDDLAEVTDERIVVPASEIIHDRMVALFHHLIGVTPIYACGAAAIQGLTIQGNSTKLFANGGMPGGVLEVPGAIDDGTALRLKNDFETNFGGENYGRLLVLGDSMKYVTTQRQTAVDSELIKQMKWSDERICSAYHVPPYMVGVGDWPPYANTEPALQAYFSQCIQSHLRKFELCLDRGLGIDEKIEGKQYGTEFDIDDLIWMDNTTRVESAQKAILGGSSPNEVRKKYHGSGPVAGGEMPYLQEQNWPLSLLAARELPTRQPTAPAELPPAEDDDEVIDMAATWAALRQKSLEVGLYGA